MCMDNLCFYFYASYVHMLVHVSAYSPFFKRVFCFCICCVKVARIEIQQPSGKLGVKVLRSILILSSHLHLAFSSGLFS